MAKKKSNVRFIRKGGRIIPIRVKGKNTRALKDITRRKNHGNLGKIAAATATGLGGLFAAGKLQSKSNLLLKSAPRKSAAINRAAKILKFSSKALPALVVGSALASIDKRSKDEATLLDIGNKQGAFNIGASLVGAFAFARLGKRFEKFGLRGGKFPVKLRDI